MGAVRERSPIAAGRPPRPRAGRTGRLAAAGVAVAAAVTLGAPSVDAAPANSFSQTNLVANAAPAGARLVDPNLTNAWGLAAGPGGPVWVSDNNSGDVSVYSGGVGAGAVTLDLTVAVPGGNPTGQVVNPTHSFPVGGPTGNPASFIVDSDSIGATQSPGEIAAWDGGTDFVVEDSPTGGPGGTTPSGAVFKGLALSAAPAAGPELFATDVANARVDVFSASFGPVRAPGEFTDPAIPTGYAPFGIQALGGKIYVTYAKQNKARTNVVPGAGLGYVDVYSPDGVLLRHLVAGGSTSPLNEPWGLAIAPKGFGPFAGDLLVGNLGDGRINAFDPATGAYRGDLLRPSGKPVAIGGLWGLEVGTTAFGGPSSVVFSAGPGAYGDGLVGIVTPSR